MNDSRQRRVGRGFLLAPVLALALGGCSTLVREEVAAPPAGGAVAMRANTPLVISLPPDPSAGYGWVLKSGSPNLYLVGGPDYTPTPKPPGLVGVADTTVYRFRAREPGTGTLEFAWRAPPGQAATPERVIRYDVTIGPGPWLPTTFFGTWGSTGASLRASPGTPSATAGNTSPATSSGTSSGTSGTPSGTGGGNGVKYWSF
ncbi:MAG: protease inhibitor I42 family protein [Betaproteobacteria bacterium]